ncbi:hypothetical protein SAMN02745898_101324 [Streptomyces sp. 136MFCol5.1]|nr:hypothetical protein SAMN02745898_101324 [Streptomyces sp. 136MFCol5.1]
MCNPTAAEHQAERVAHRVREDPVAPFPLTRKTPGSQCQNCALRSVGILHADVQMHLLRVLRIGQTGGLQWSVCWKASCREPGSVPITTHFSESSLTRMPRSSA